MSETQIIKKLTTPTVQVSSLDGHKIVGPALRRPIPGQATPQRPRSGQPLQTTPANVQISRRPSVAHVTGTSSAQSSTIKGTPPIPPALAKARAEKAAQSSQVSDHLPDAPTPATRRR
jgi:hypothetical protein